jgi:AcrR family transcriptional regulator
MQTGSRQALPSARSEATRAALVRAALDLFGAKGFEGTSTREIAARAGANIATIAYHFGGKEGLRAACADFVVGTMSQVFAVAEAAANDRSLSPADAQAALRRIGEALVDAIVVRNEAHSLARFMVREMFEPSPAFERLHSAFRPIHARTCGLWARATGAEPESESTKLAVFSFIGQIIYFRVARPVVIRILHWSEIGPREAAAIKKRIVFNLDAAFELSRKTHP